MSVESYSFGSMTVNGKKYNSDIIVYPDRVSSKWWRRNGHYLAPEDLDEVFDYRPDIVVVGQGAYGAMKIPDDTQKRMKEEGIELIAADTGTSVKRFNQELEKGRKVVGAFHLTC